MPIRRFVRSGLQRIQSIMRAVVAISAMTAAAAGHPTMVTAVAAAVVEASLVARTTAERFWYLTVPPASSLLEYH
jgi:hypothetical protein